MTLLSGYWWFGGPNFTITTEPDLIKNFRFRHLENPFRHYPYNDSIISTTEDARIPFKNAFSRKPAMLYSVHGTWNIGDTTLKWNTWSQLVMWLMRFPYIPNSIYWIKHCWFSRKCVVGRNSWIFSYFQLYEIFEFHANSVIPESSHCGSFGICEYCTRVQMCDLAVIQIMTKKVTKG